MDQQNSIGEEMDCSSTKKRRCRIVFLFLPKAATVEMPVMVMLRWRLPPSMCVHRLDTPPPGLQPVMNRPNCNAGLCDSSNFDRPNADYRAKKKQTNKQTNQSIETRTANKLDRPGTKVGSNRGLCSERIQSIRNYKTYSLLII